MVRVTDARGRTDRVDPLHRPRDVVGGGAGRARRGGGAARRQASESRVRSTGATGARKVLLRVPRGKEAEHETQSRNLLGTDQTAGVEAHLGAGSQPADAPGGSATADGRRAAAT